MILKMNDGRLVQFNTSSRMITLNGESCILSVMRDITEGRRTEKVLGASELRYRRLFETAKDGILILDAETGMVVDVNPFLITTLGYSHEEFLGKAVWELGFFKDIVANEDNFAELREKEYLRYENLPLETIDGQRIEVEFISNLYLVNGCKVIQCIVRDVTARRKAEEAVIERTAQLEAANKELEAFSYSVSHDLRAPLRAMDGFSQAVLEDYGAQLPEEGRRYLQTIREGAQQMGALIDDLADVFAAEPAAAKQAGRGYRRAGARYHRGVGLPAGRAADRDSRRRPAAVPGRSSVAEAGLAEPALECL